MNNFQVKRKSATNEWPCTKDCPERRQGCHAECERYIKAKERNDANKAELREKRMAKQAVDSYIAHRVSEVTGKPLKSR